MAEYNEQDLNFATELADLLASRSGRHAEFPVPIDDVHELFQDFEEDADAVSGQGLPGLPAIMNMYDGLPVTVAISEFFPRVSLFGDPHRWRSSLFDRLGRFGAAFVPVEYARDAMRQLTAKFIASRIAGIRELEDRGATTLRLAGQTTPGCTFSVNTKSPGLRVHWSGAYRISGNYFSHPTSPASSTLQSGVYVFGVDGGAYRSVEWDTAKVTLPGPHTSIYLNF